MSTMAAADLRCMICPKHPKFSDQSHLLTHISSKEQNLQAYDTWYRKNDIAKLLSQRLEAKESKQQKLVKRASPAPISSGTASLSRFDYEETPCPMPPRAGLSNVTNYCIDPNLDRIGPYHPVGCREGFPYIEALGDSSKIHLQTPVATMYPPRSAEKKESDWVITPQREFEATRGLFDLKYAGSYVLPDSIYQVPTSSGGSGFRFDTEEAETALSMAESASTTSHSRKTSTTLTTFEQDGNSDYHRLKGTIWPGMDLFDTANDELKRRRNQKKDKAAFVQLAEDSDAIEPTEVIYFYPSWELKKARFISGNVESSPIRDDAPVVKRKNRVSRKPLLELDLNVPIKERKARGSKHSNKTGGKPQPRKAKRVFPETDDEIIDLMQPFQSLGGSRKRTFKVFEDGSPKPNQESPTRGIFSKRPHRVIRHIHEDATLENSTSVGDMIPSIRSYSPKPSGTVTGLLYSTPQPNQKVWLQNIPLGSPPKRLSPRPGTDNPNPSQLITPRRIFLRSPARYGAPSRDAEFGFGIPLPSYYLRGADLSPLDFSIPSAPAYNPDKTPKVSPLRAMQLPLSPSERVCKKKRADRLQESSDDETIDLGVGDEDESYFFP